MTSRQPKPTRYFVCDDHFNDSHLNDFIRENAVSERCDYCRRVEDINCAALFDDVAEFIREAVQTEYADANEELPWDSREGGFQWAETYDTQDLLVDQLELELDHQSPLFQDLLNALGDQTWCEAEPFTLKESGRLRYSWDQFCQVTKHRSRFFFSEFTYPSDDPDHPEERLSRPRELLDTIADHSRELRLIRLLSPDQDIFRVRLGDEPHDDAENIGTNTAQRAKASNRMSPAGIPMFYGAFNPAVALAETYDGTFPTTVSTGRFRLTEPVSVLDLSEIPSISLFDEKRRHLREATHFLRSFQRAISEPVAHDGFEHVGYAPTQVMTEYFRYAFRDANQNQIQGIVYQSAKVPEERAVVLFFEAEHCGDYGSLSPKHRIALIDASHVSFVMKAVPVAP